jgi:cytochrome c
MKLACLTLVAGLAAFGAAQAQSYSIGKGGAEKPQLGSGEALLKSSGCGECHARQTNLAAPALLTISAKYQGNPNAVSIITTTVRNGKHGREVLTMPPHSNVSDADAKTIADYILSLKRR